MHLCKVFACDGFKSLDMKKDRLTWMFAIGLLGLLGFSSCSPRLRPRRVQRDIDTIFVLPPDTVRIKPGSGDLPPIKLMYGVPPARFEQMQMPEKELK